MKRSWFTTALKVKILQDNSAIAKVNQMSRLLLGSSLPFLKISRFQAITPLLSVVWSRPRSQAVDGPQIQITMARYKMMVLKKKTLSQ